MSRVTCQCWVYTKTAKRGVGGRHVALSISHVAFQIGHVSLMSMSRFSVEFTRRLPSTALARQATEPLRGCGAVRCGQPRGHTRSHDCAWYVATHCNALRRTATHCNTLQHTATHCNILQHTATLCNTLGGSGSVQCGQLRGRERSHDCDRYVATNCNALRQAGRQACVRMFVRV